MSNAKESVMGSAENQNLTDEEIKRLEEYHQTLIAAGFTAEIATNALDKPYAVILPLKEVQLLHELQRYDHDKYGSPPEGVKASKNKSRADELSIDQQALIDAITEVTHAPKSIAIDFVEDMGKLTTVKTMLEAEDVRVGVLLEEEVNIKNQIDKLIIQRSKSFQDELAASGLSGFNGINFIGSSYDRRNNSLVELELRSLGPKTIPVMKGYEDLTLQELSDAVAKGDHKDLLKGFNVREYSEDRMHLIVHISNTDNDAFTGSLDARHEELFRLFKVAENKIEEKLYPDSTSDDFGYPLMDINGNTVGSVSLQKSLPQVRAGQLLYSQEIKNNQPLDAEKLAKDVGEMASKIFNRQIDIYKNPIGPNSEIRSQISDYESDAANGGKQIMYDAINDDRFFKLDESHRDYDEEFPYLITHPDVRGFDEGNMYGILVNVNGETSDGDFMELREGDINQVAAVELDGIKSKLAAIEDDLTV